MQHVFEITAVLILWQCMVSQGVMKCPGSTEDWQTASMSLQCREPNYYHCLRDENGHITQQCLQRVWIQEGMCPEFNTKARRIDVYECKSSQNNCPTTTYWSNAVYIYPGCFQNASSIAWKSTTSLTFPVTTRNEITTKDGESANDKSTIKNPANTTAILPIIIPCIIGVVLLVLFLVVGYIFFRRKRRKNRSELTEINTEGRHIDNQSPDEENMLQGTELTESNTEGRHTDNQSPEEESMLQETVSELTKINTGGRQTDSQSPEEEIMLQELRPSDTQTERGHNANSNSCIKEGYSHNSGMKPENDSTELDEQLSELVEKIKENRMHGMERITVVLIVSQATVGEDKIAEAARIMDENVVDENDFNKWMKNKSKRMYVFKDWVLSDQEKCITELKKIFIDVLESVIKNDTKFVIIFPLSIWTEDKKLQEIWRYCPVCKIIYSSY